MTKHGVAWQPWEDIQVLRREVSDGVLAERLGRTKRSIHKRRKRLQVARGEIPEDPRRARMFGSLAPPEA